jgi:hypothetical protein
MLRADFATIFHRIESRLTGLPLPNRRVDLLRAERLTQIIYPSGNRRHFRPVWLGYFFSTHDGNPVAIRCGCNTSFNNCNYIQYFEITTHPLCKLLEVALHQNDDRTLAEK